MVKNNPIYNEYENKFSYDDLIEYAKSLFEPKPEDKERVICVPKDAYDMIEELRRNNYDKNINK